MAPSKKSRTTAKQGKRSVRKTVNEPRKRKKKEPKPEKVKKERKPKETYVQRKFRERISRSGMKSGSLLNYFQMSKIMRDGVKNDSDENSQSQPKSHEPEEIKSSPPSPTNFNEEELYITPFSIRSLLPADEYEPESQQFDIDETNINSFLKIEIGDTFSSFSLPASPERTETRPEPETQNEFDFENIIRQELLEFHDNNQLGKINNATITSPKFESDEENDSQEDKKHLIQIAKNIFEDSSSQENIKEENKKSFIKSEQNVVIPDIYKNYK